MRKRDFRNDFSMGTKKSSSSEEWFLTLDYPESINYAHATSLFLVPFCLLHPSDMSIGHVGKSPSLGVWWHEEPDSTKYSSLHAGPEKWLEALTHRMSCRKQRAASSIVAPRPSSRPKLYPLLTEGAHRKLPQPVLAVRLVIQSGLTRVGSLVPSGRLDWYKRP